MTDDDWLALELRRQNRESFRHQPPEPVRRVKRHVFTLQELAVAERWAASIEKKRETA